MLLFVSETTHRSKLMSTDTAPLSPKSATDNEYLRLHAAKIVADVRFEAAAEK
jgi:hypothetical protein